PAVYYAQAKDVLAGKVVPDHAYFHSSPLYPFFLAAVARVGGSGLQTVRIVQACLGVCSVYLVFLLARLTVGKRAGLVSAFLAAVYVPFIFFEAEILEITIVIAAVLGSLLMLVARRERPGPLTAAVAGALLGVAGMGKPNILLFAPVGALWLLMTRGAEARGHRGRTGPRARTLSAALFFIAAGCVVLPATIHNYRAEGDFIPVSSNGGINFFIGNHANSPGVFQVPPDMRFDLRAASQAAAERVAGRTLSAGEVSGFWTRETLRQIAADPAGWIRLAGRKFVLFWNHYEIPNHYHLYFVQTFAPVLRIPVGTFGVVAPLGVLGLALALLRRKKVGVLVVFGLTFMISVVAFFITGRYRLAVVPVLLVGAGYSVDWLWLRARARRWRSLAIACVCLAVLAVGVNVHMIEFGFAQMYNSVGSILGTRGDMEGAAAEFEKAVGANPDDLSSRYNLGLALLELARYDEAARQFEAAVARYRRYHEAWIGLARARSAQGRPEEALEALTAAESLDPPAVLAAEIERMKQSLTGPDDAKEEERNQ
ncbi:MAG: glycosyltransferase family 39 protein, partial [Candidatus Eisenbacteria bacterium]|nr:glycosyltransferase family 39 protein [Candidatus Eisenbacteria bacterium]